MRVNRLNPTLSICLWLSWMASFRWRINKRNGWLRLEVRHWFMVLWLEKWLSVNCQIGTVKFISSRHLTQFPERKLVYIQYSVFSILMGRKLSEVSWKLISLDCAHWWNNYSKIIFDGCHWILNNLFWMILFAILLWNAKHCTKTEERNTLTNII